MITTVDSFLAGVSPSALVECRVRAARAMPLPTTGGGAQSIWRHAEATITRHYGGLVFTIRDVSDRVALRDQLAYNAYHDALTGLPNRALFTERLEQAVSQRSAREHPPAVLFLDLDWFKAVNDAQGHAAGDALLVEAAARLRASVRVGDTVARFGGDEFAALVHSDPQGKAAAELAARLHAALTRPGQSPRDTSSSGPRSASPTGGPAPAPRNCCARRIWPCTRPRTAARDASWNAPRSRARSGRPRCRGSGSEVRMPRRPVRRLETSGGSRVLFETCRPPPARKRELVLGQRAG